MTQHHPGYRHVGGNVFVATADAQTVRIAPGRLQPEPPPPPPPTEEPAGSITMLASMRRELARAGMEPVGDPGAGLPPAEASMRREIARMGC